MARGTIVDTLVTEFRGDTKNLDKSVNKSVKTIQSFSSRARKAFRGLGRAFFSLRGAAVSLGLALTFKGAISASIRLDQLANKMLAATKSAGVAANSFEFLDEVTERLGLSYIDAADGFAGFSAAALRAGLTLGETKQIFEDMATASTSLQLSADRVSLVFRALEQIASKGTLQMEELKLQLGDSLPGALEIAARAMDVTSAELIKMIENGEIMAKEFLPRFGAAIKEELGGSAETAATQLQAQTNRMKKAFFELQNEFADNGAGEAYRQGIIELRNLFKDPEFRESIKEISGLIGLFTFAIIDSTKELSEFFGITRGAQIRKLGKELEQFKSFQTDNVFSGTFLGDIEASRYDDDVQRIENRIKELKELTEAENIFAGVRTEYDEQQALFDQHLKNLDDMSLGTGGVAEDTDALEKAVKKASKAIEDILEPSEKYSITLDEIEKLSMSGALAQAAANVGLTEAEAKTRLLSNATKDFSEAMEESKEETIRARNELADFFAEGIEGANNFRDAAVRALQDVLRNMLRVALGGTAEESIFGKLGGSLGGALSQGIGSLFGGPSAAATAAAARGAANPALFGPGFANGGMIMENRSTGGPDNQVVTLRKSKNERISVTRPGQSFSQAQQGTTIVQNLNISTGVQQTVRAELARFMPQIRDTSVKAVEEALSRSILKG